MLAEAAIKERIIKFIYDYFVKDTGIIMEEDTSFLDEGILDSTGVLELVAFLETAFEIRVEDEEIIPENFDSQKKLVEYIRKKLASKL